MSLQRLNLYTPRPAPLDLAQEAEPKVALKVEPTAPSGVTKQRVLLLDDQDDFREVIAEYLTSRFYEVTAVSNGAEGLRAIMQDSFDLIVCDMMMPKVDGEMFYWAVTRLRPAAGQRFIFFTGHQNDPKIQHFFRRVNATVLIKPFGLDALNTAILDVVKKLR